MKDYIKTFLNRKWNPSTSLTDNTDKEKKLGVVDRKTPDTTGLVKKTNCDIKNTENEIKIHDTSGLVSNATLYSNVEIKYQWIG